MPISTINNNDLLSLPPIGLVILCSQITANNYITVDNKYYKLCSQNCPVYDVVQMHDVLSYEFNSPPLIQIAI